MMPDTAPALPLNHPQPGFGKRAGVLLVNLGTPDGTDYWSMRRYLKEFLSDPRVIEVPRLLWWLILNGIILTFRPSKSGHAYEQIWDKTHNASPLRVITAAQTKNLQNRFGDNVLVRFGMRYGQPAIGTVLAEMQAQGCGRIVLMPMYPQYSSSTVATVVDKAHDWMRKQRWQPTLRVAPPYYDHPAYIGALDLSLKVYLKTLDWVPDVVVASFHGLPKVYCTKGDVYYCHSHKTARLLAEKSNLAFCKSVADLKTRTPQLLLTFQSRFGAQEWLQPYLDVTLGELPAKGFKKVLVIAPGFAADCVETLEEISVRGHETFMEAGGTHFAVVPCLNDSEAGMDMLEGLVEMELDGWLEAVG